MNVQKTNLGSILVDMGYLGTDELNCAISAQKITQSGIPLGKILVENGLIKEDQLKEALEIQQKLRSNDRIKRAHGMAQVAQNSCENVIESVEELKRRSDHIKRKSTGKGYAAITQKMLIKDIPKE